MPNIKYTCKYCGYMFDTEKDAEYCENLHAHVEGFDLSRIYYKHNYLYPDIIYVKFDNGEIVEYREV